MRTLASMNRRAREGRQAMAAQKATARGKRVRQQDPKLKPRWDVHSRGEQDQLGSASEAI